MSPVTCQLGILYWHLVADSVSPSWTPRSASYLYRNCARADGVSSWDMPACHSEVDDALRS